MNNKAVAIFLGISRRSGAGDGGAVRWPDRDLRHRGGRLHLRVPDDRLLQGDVRVLHRQDSSQYKGPFNQIDNEARVFTPKDTAIVTPNSDTPYSFCRLDLRAEPIVHFRAGRWRKSDTTRCSSATVTRSITATSAAARPATKPADYMVAGPDWKGETPAGIEKVFHCETRSSRSSIYPHAALRPGRHGQRHEGPGRLQGAAALARICISPRRPPPRPINWPKIQQGHGQDRISSRISTCLLQFCPCRAGREGDPGEVRPHRHRAGQAVRLQGTRPANTRPKSGSA